MNTIRVCDIKKKFYYTREKNSRVIGDLFSKNKIKVGLVNDKKKIGPPEISIEKSDYDKAYNVLDSIQYCNLCNEKFKVVFLNTKYCSPKCRNKVSRSRFKEGSSKPKYKLRESNEDLAACSTECLLEKFGDIE